MAMSTWRPTASLTMGSRTRSHKHSRECSKDAPSCSYAWQMRTHTHISTHAYTAINTQVKTLVPECIKEFLNLLYRSRPQEAISPPARAVVCCGCTITRMPSDRANNTRLTRLPRKDKMEGQLPLRTRPVHAEISPWTVSCARICAIHSRTFGRSSSWICRSSWSGCEARSRTFNRL